jgi:hypothetical protein
LSLIIAHLQVAEFGNKAVKCHVYEWLEVFRMNFDEHLSAVEATLVQLWIAVANEIHASAKNSVFQFGLGIMSRNVFDKIIQFVDKIKKCLMECFINTK